MRVWWGVPMMAAMLLAVGHAADRKKTHGCACLHNGAAPHQLRYKWRRPVAQRHAQPRSRTICLAVRQRAEELAQPHFPADVDMTKGSPGRLTPSARADPAAMHVSGKESLRRLLPAHSNNGLSR